MTIKFAEARMVYKGINRSFCASISWGSMRACAAMICDNLVVSVGGLNSNLFRCARRKRYQVMSVSHHQTHGEVSQEYRLAPTRKGEFLTTNPL